MCVRYGRSGHFQTTVPVFGTVIRDEPVLACLAVGVMQIGENGVSVIELAPDVTEGEIAEQTKVSLDFSPLRGLPLH